MNARFKKCTKPHLEADLPVAVERVKVVEKDSAAIKKRAARLVEATVTLVSANQGHHWTWKAGEEMQLLLVVEKEVEKEVEVETEMEVETEVEEEEEEEGEATTVAETEAKEEKGAALAEESQAEGKLAHSKRKRKQQHDTQQPNGERLPARRLLGDRPIDYENKVCTRQLD